jgi:hypothetical protein
MPFLMLARWHHPHPESPVHHRRAALSRRERRLFPGRGLVLSSDLGEPAGQEEAVVDAAGSPDQKNSSSTSPASRRRRRSTTSVGLGE